MVTLTWLRGLFLNRRGRLIATAAGVATAVALIASIGTFTASTASKMTTRAAATVPVDWQVEVQPGFNPNSVLSTVRSSPNVTKALPIAIAPTGGLSSKTGGTVQTTGSGKVLGLPPGYAKAFPGEIRTLNGSPNGVVLAQQTAANLHARPGDTIRIQRPGAGPVDLKVSGVVDLPAADSLFQRVGAPTGSQPQAPPDNVVLMPQSLFNRIEAPALNTNQVKTQIHTSLAHRLPANPSAAFTSVSGAARNLEVKLAGGGLVGDNLGVALDQARSDALYAQLLFLFLGIPGAALVASITVVATTAAADRRRREAALLRTRGASTGRLVRIAVGEAIATGIIGVIVGLLAARAIGSIAFNTGSFGAGTTTAIYWAAGASVIGLTVAAAAIAIPGWRYARALTVAGQRRQIERREGRPIWKRFGLDLIALAISGFIYWQASKNGYKLVLAPEGVPQISVNWYALLAPVLAWIGVGLLSYRLAEMFLARG
ncbi:MAG TPA: ABC transporter permease, partial [Solirubrobacterales bacterium]|nr:ABC transporter permease [Solirubrobacterales bacterium]